MPKKNEVTPYQRQLGMMHKIANDNQSLEDIKNLTSSKVNDQLKVFLISQARTELNRVIKLTEFLDKVESSFMTRAEESMMNDSLSIKQYGDIISIITASLQRSNNIIYNVLKDDSLTTILNTTVYSSQSTSQTTSVISNLRDPQSREKVRAVVNKIIMSTNNYIPEREVIIDE